MVTWEGEVIVPETVKHLPVVWENSSRLWSPNCCRRCSRHHDEPLLLAVLNFRENIVLFCKLLHACEYGFLSDLTERGTKTNSVTAGGKLSSFPAVVMQMTVGSYHERGK